MDWPRLPRQNVQELLENDFNAILNVQKINPEAIEEHKPQNLLLPSILRSKCEVILQNHGNESWQVLIITQA